MLDGGAMKHKLETTAVVAAAVLGVAFGAVAIGAFAVDPTAIRQPCCVENAEDLRRC
jgi:hypothetical protein